ncbi:MAG: hypothetical protein DMF73_09875 [Acidobacteria bacterium]|nr:MAG: hypothetical protein DMF73_09875 [Acidobacteriota bacterium]
MVRPRFPPAAVGIESNSASVVQLDRARGGWVVRRAASVNLPAELIKPGFDRTNISDQTEAARTLEDLVTSAGLLRQRKFSASLPEAATRSAIVTIEGAATSRRETEELFEWKVERSFGAPLSELRVSRRLEVLAEYESLFHTLRWHTGLILPRHAGEEQWLRNGNRGDGLLLTAYEEGFTAVLMRGDRPLVVRSVFCEPAECDDELHRILLFYRDRAGAQAEAAVDRLLVIGEQLDKKRVAEIAQDALGVNLKPLNAVDVGLLVPADSLKFDAIAAPAGLARLAW